MGEVLFDLLPSGPKLGGAPANLAYHAARLGAHAALVSRVGADDYGKRATRALSGAGVDVSAVSTDPVHPTGTVAVTVRAGEPRYVISPDAAWDHIDFGLAASELLERADVVCLGTLASRTPDQALRIEGVLAALRQRNVRPKILLDLNLRPPHVDPQKVLHLVRQADLLKLSEEEHRILTELLDHAPEELVRAGELELLIVTRGAGESSLVSAARVLRKSPPKATPGGDAVGAGDAFAAALAVSLARGAELEVAFDRALVEGTRVASAIGAMPGVSA